MCCDLRNMIVGMSLGVRFGHEFRRGSSAVQAGDLDMSLGAGMEIGVDPGMRNGVWATHGIRCFGQDGTCYPDWNTLVLLPYQISDAFGVSVTYLVPPSGISMK